MRTFLIIAFGLAVVLALSESSPANDIEDKAESLLSEETILEVEEETRGKLKTFYLNDSQDLG